MKKTNIKIQLLLESILKVDGEFMNILRRMSADDDDVPFVTPLIDLIRWQEDIETNYNFIRSSKDKNDEIEFIPDSQAKRLKDGEDGFTKKPSFSKIGRFVRQIMTGQGKTVTDKEIEKFVNKYKSTWDLFYTNLNDRIKLVEGEEIRHWYNSKNYKSDGDGELGNSCMRSPSKSQYFQIYEKNPDIVKLLIFTNDDNLLLGRALFWKLHESSEGHEYYLDRIYTRFNSDKDILINWIKNAYPNKKIAYHKDGSANGEMKVLLDEVEFEKYPYVDTFVFLYEEDKIVSNKRNDQYRGHLYEMSDTGGGRELVNYVRCKFEYYDEKYPMIDTYKSYAGYYVLKSKAVKCELFDSWIHENDVTYCDYYNSNISQYDSVESEKYGTLPRSKASWVIVGFRENGDYIKDYYPDDLYQKEFILINNRYIKTSLCVTDLYGSHIMQNNAIKIYIEKNNKNLRSTKIYSYLDVYLFDIDISDMDETYISKQKYIEKYYEEDSNFYYDDLIKKLDSLASSGKDQEMVNKKKEEAKEYHLNEFYSYSGYRNKYIQRKYGDREDVELKLRTIIKGVIAKYLSDYQKIKKYFKEYAIEIDQHDPLEDAIKHYDVKYETPEDSNYDILINNFLEDYLVIYVINGCSTYWSSYDSRRLVGYYMDGSLKSHLQSYFIREHSDISKELCSLIDDRESELRMITYYFDS